MFRLLSAQCYDTRAFRKGQKWDCTIVFERVHIRADLAQISHWTWYVCSVFNFIFLHTGETGPTCSHYFGWRYRPWRPYINAQAFQKATWDTCRQKFSVFWIAIHLRWPTGFTAHLPIPDIWIKKDNQLWNFCRGWRNAASIARGWNRWVWHCGQCKCLVTRLMLLS